MFKKRDFYKEKTVISISKSVEFFMDQGNIFLNFILYKKNLVLILLFKDSKILAKLSRKKHILA